MKYLSLISKRLLILLALLMLGNSFINPAKAETKPEEEINLRDSPQLSTDATAAFQAAFDSGARRVIIPNLGKPYQVGPLLLRQHNQEIIFEKGVEVHAKPGAFQDTKACLLTLRLAVNVNIQGNGAVFRMNRDEYGKPGHPDPLSAQRHVIDLQGAQNVTIDNVVVSGAGGDGIHITDVNSLQEHLPSSVKTRLNWYITTNRDITLRNIVSTNNRRQGLSLISGEDILIEDCVFENTHGSSPQSGIDIEPYAARQLLKNIVVRRCIARNNSGAGFMVYLGKLKKTSQPVSIRFEDCIVEGGVWGLNFSASGTDGVQGKVLFKDCTVKDTQKGGIYIYDKDAKGTEVVFENCTLSYAAKLSENTDAATPDEDDKAAARAQATRKAPPTAPIVFYLRQRDSLEIPIENFGGLQFINCRVEESAGRPISAYGTATEKEDFPVASIHGTITTNVPEAALNLGTQQTNVTLKLKPTRQ